tara:strand:- start:35895 stop:37283 length:1389 start_codon:yes stop_codon:yes gene_type:complete
VGTIHTTYAQQRAKYVFYFIGDGMGPLQREVGEQYLKGITNDPDATLLMNQLPVQGYIHTRSANNEVTDSAAAGTALACGHKTNNGAIGLLPDLKTSIPTIAELAHQFGLKVGILSTVTLDHATPACFYAHQANRSEYFPIAEQLAKSKFEYFAGGGLAGLKNDQQNNLDLATTNGFIITQTLGALAEQKPGMRVIALNDSPNAQRSPLPYDLERNEKDITLAEFVSHAVRLLDNDKGFFMMVEGGKIDWAGHGNAIGTMAREVTALDDAVKVAMKFYNDHPDDTLIIVTADHETGGMQKIGKPNAAYLAGFNQSYDQFKSKLKQLVKDKATYEQAIQMATEHFRLDPFTDEHNQVMKITWTALLSGEPIKHNHGKNNQFTENCLKLAAHKAGYKFTTHGHSKADVPISAIGVGATWFKETQDNTSVPKHLYQLITGMPMSVLDPPPSPTPTATTTDEAQTD